MSKNVLWLAKDLVPVFPQCVILELWTSISQIRLSFFQFLCCTQHISWSLILVTDVPSIFLTCTLLHYLTLTMLWVVDPCYISIQFLWPCSNLQLHFTPWNLLIHYMSQRNSVIIDKMGNLETAFVVFVFVFPSFGWFVLFLLLFVFCVCVCMHMWVRVW